MLALLGMMAAVVTAQPTVSAEVLEPSVMNEVEHALSKAPKASKFVKHEFAAGKSASERAIALVSAQKTDGRWLDGTNDVTFAAVSELKRLAFGDGSFKILMIGNSFSICNTHHMPQICEAMGIEMELGSLYIGGCSFERHWKNVVAATNASFAPYRYDFYQGAKQLVKKGSSNIPQTLKSRRWDLVTIQQCSHFSWKPESYHPFADDLVKLIRELAPQAEIMVQETWSYTPWDGRLAKWGIDQNEMYAKLHDAYGQFAKEYGFRVIPMGTAVQEWRRRLPVKYAADSLGGDVTGSAKFVRQDDGTFKAKGDVFHLGNRGEYYQSLVWTASIFGVDVSGCSYRFNGVSKSDDRLMKTIAGELGAMR